MGQLPKFNTENENPRLFPILGTNLWPPPSASKWFSNFSHYYWNKKLVAVSQLSFWSTLAQRWLSSSNLWRHIFGSGLYLPLYTTLHCGKKIGDVQITRSILSGNWFMSVASMAIRVVEFSSGGYKIRKIFAKKSTYPKDIIEFCVLD